MGNKIEVSAFGKSTALYDTVRLNVSFASRATSGKEASEELEKSVTALEQLLASYPNLNGKRPTDRKLALVYGDRSAPPVYEARYTTSFVLSDVSLLRPFQQALIELPLASVDSPQYGFTDPEKLRLEAVKDAWDKVRSRLNSTNEIIFGRHSETWHPVSWDIDYREYEAFRKVANNSPAEEQQGVAVAEVQLTVVFKKKKG